ncbi:hypothetical protein CDD81_5263 [Ophiocordyceps australis]|uniref:Glycosyltransferase family 31 protein n=1 Tax=Ophiocordyceps australis TaxID=1399860 RepID=A0A2C5YJ35_9HYPO|nr:hypothetical protein CDD81_5263 [Ophiocordyceps australis]
MGAMAFSPWMARVRRMRSWPLLLLALYCTIIMVLPLQRIRDEGSGEGEAVPRDRQVVEQKVRLTRNSLYGRGMEAHVHQEWDFDRPCSRMPDTDDVLFVLKTGTSEAFDKLPTQLLGSVQCLSDVLIFSDKEQQIGKYHLYDALDRVSDTVKKTSPEFELYEAQLNCPVSLRDCTTPSQSAAWDLDKYKFLNILVRTWEMRPGHQYYLFAEADSYVFWPNMMTWLRNHAASMADDLYAGSVALQDDFPFAHGGSGYIVSGRVVQRLVEAVPGLAARYDGLAPTKCCGDLLLGMAMHEAGVVVRHAFPMFNGEKTAVLPFGETHWCQPILTLHHMDAEDVATMWQFEQTRTSTKTLQIKDLYHAFVEPHLIPLRPDWDNLSEDTCLADPDSPLSADDLLSPLLRPQADKSPLEARAHASPSACAAACHASGLTIPQADLDALLHDSPPLSHHHLLPHDADTDAAIAHLVARRYDARVAGPDAAAFKAARRCLQWRFRTGLCCFSESLRLGHATSRDAAEPQRWTSGWFVRGAADWTKAHDGCKPAWVKPEEIRPP